jgi:hypothetical protein
MMAHRVRWMAAGLLIGAGGSVWVERKVRSVAGRYGPAGLAGTAGTRARGLGADVRAALLEGRDAMRAREAQLRRDASQEGIRAPSRP